MTRRKEGLLFMVLGATALALSAPWWFLGTLSASGFGPRLGLQIGLVLLFIGFFWMFKREREDRPSRRRRGPRLRAVAVPTAVPLRVVPSPATDRNPRKRPD